MTVFQEELKEARKTGSMDEVFGKYCAKTPAFKKCVKNLTDTLKQCLDDNEKSTMDTVLEVLKRLGEFLCYNDGDRLASKCALIRKLLRYGCRLIMRKQVFAKDCRRIVAIKSK